MFFALLFLVNTCRRYALFSYTCLRFVITIKLIFFLTLLEEIVSESLEFNREFGFFVCTVFSQLFISFFVNEFKAWLMFLLALIGLQVLFLFINTLQMRHNDNKIAKHLLSECIKIIAYFTSYIMLLSAI